MPPSGEINLFHVNQDDRRFQGNLFSGVAEVDSGFRSGRMFTNGQVVPGDTILESRIYIAVDRIHNVFDLFVRLGDFEEDRSQHPDSSSSRRC